MPLFGRTRPGRRRRRDYLRFGLVVLFLTLTIDTFRLAYPHSSPLAVRVDASTTERQPADRLFIASIHWNNEPILRGRWNDAVVKLVDYLGRGNVYVSVLESGSWDDSKGALRELDAKLGEMGIERTITLEDTTHEELISQTPPPGEEGWVWTPTHEKALRRIPYLAQLRNRVMDDMLKVQQQSGKVFDKVLWLNDVVFSVDDIATLLATNGGSYASACSLDFSKPPAYYDTFALRDSSGTQPISSAWPYFLSTHSLGALIASAPIPVQSCWNGVVAMDAEPFYANNSAALRFRGVPDSLATYHLEGSECCLIHTDNPLSYAKGVFLNPLVRVGYNPEAYEAVAASQPGLWPSGRSRVFGMWYVRWRTVVGLPRRVTERMVVRKRLQKWKQERADAGQEEDIGRGEICLINEMQILAQNGWRHV